jgi:hypothetical protein
MLTSVPSEVAATCSRPGPGFQPADRQRVFAQAMAVFEQEEVGILQVLRGQAVLAGERMAGRRGEQELVIEQRHRLDAGGVIGQGDEGGVEGAGLELIDEAAGAVLVEIELQVGILFGQHTDGLGQDERARWSEWRRG